MPKESNLEEHPKKNHWFLFLGILTLILIVTGVLDVITGMWGGKSVGFIITALLVIWIPALIVHFFFKSKDIFTLCSVVLVTLIIFTAYLIINLEFLNPCTGNSACGIVEGLALFFVVMPLTFLSSLGIFISYHRKKRNNEKITMSHRVLFWIAILAFIAALLFLNPLRILGIF